MFFSWSFHSPHSLSLSLSLSLLILTISQVCGEKNRFEKLMEYFRNDDCNIDFMVSQHTHTHTFLHTFTHSYTFDYLIHFHASLLSCASPSPLYGCCANMIRTGTEERKWAVLKHISIGATSPAPLDRTKWDERPRGAWQHAGYSQFRNCIRKQ